MGELRRIRYILAHIVHRVVKELQIDAFLQMETINNISLLLVALVSFSCSTYDEYELFNFDVVEVDDIPAEKLDVRYVGKSTYPLDMCSIENGYLISYHPQNEHMFVATSRKYQGDKGSASWQEGKKPILIRAGVHLTVPSKPH